MQTKVNFIWLLLVTGFLAGCQTPEPNQASETVSAVMEVEHVEVNVVPAIEPATTPPTTISVGQLEVRIYGKGELGQNHQMSHEFQMYDGKVYYNGELISISDYLWEIMPDEQN